MSEGFLTYERELEISDLLVARAEAQRRIDEAETPSKSDLRAVEEGNNAATELVEAYLPRVYHIASGVMRMYSLRLNQSIEIEELIQEGVVAALKCTWSFNARGKDGVPGRRFSTYSYLAINKAMKRYMAKMSTPLTSSVNRIISTWAWNATRNRLIAETGEEPSSGKVMEESGIRETSVDNDLPIRSMFADVDDPEGPGLSDAVSQGVMAYNEEARYAFILREVLYEAFNENDEMVRAWMLYLGVDRGYARDDKQLSRDLPCRISEARDYINLFSHAIIHPKYRVKIQRALERLAPELLVEGPSASI